MVKKSWAWRIGVIALVGIVATIAIGLIALTLARYDLIEKIVGFGWFMGSQAVIQACGVIGLVALIIGFVRKNGPKWPAYLSIALALGMLGVMYYAVIAPAQTSPRLHDITTDVDDPPQFTTLSLREDNLIPFNNIEEWRAAHREGYPDIGPVVIDKSPDEVLADARALADQRGWEIAYVDAEAGQMEATAFAGYIRFRDDVIVEVTPIADGSTRVDMRSVSRVGLSDLGYNAARIREFLAALQAT